MPDRSVTANASAGRGIRLAKNLLAMSRTYDRSQITGVFIGPGRIMLIGVTGPADSILVSAAGYRVKPKRPNRKLSGSGVKSKAVLPDVLA